MTSTQRVIYTGGVGPVSVYFIGSGRTILFNAHEPVELLANEVEAALAMPAFTLCPDTPDEDDASAESTTTTADPEEEST